MQSGGSGEGWFAEAVKIGMLVLLVLTIHLTGCVGSTRQTVEYPASAPSYQSQEEELPASSSEIQEAQAPHSAEIEAPTGDLVEIGERLFIAQTNDIYLNPEDYLGKTVKYQGIFKTMDWEETGETYHCVIRYGPGCCGYDGEAGFEVDWAGDWPQEDDWCEVVGVLEIYEQSGMRYLRLALDSLTVLKERGAEFVST